MKSHDTERHGTQLTTTDNLDEVTNDKLKSLDLALKLASGSSGVPMLVHKPTSPTAFTTSCAL